MPVVTNQIHTFTCSVPECKITKTLTGNLAILKDQLTNNDGWAFSKLTFGGNDYDLCPEHNKELRTFFGFPEYQNGHFRYETSENEVDDIKAKQ